MLTDICNQQNVLLDLEKERDEGEWLWILPFLNLEYLPIDIHVSSFSTIRYFLPKSCEDPVSIYVQWLQPNQCQCCQYSASIDIQWLQPINVNPGRIMAALIFNGCTPINVRIWQGMTKYAKHQVFNIAWKRRTSSRFVDFMQNATIEERVALLEIQVTEVDERVELLERRRQLPVWGTDHPGWETLILEQDSDVFDDEIESEHLCQIQLSESNKNFCDGIKNISYNRYMSHYPVKLCIAFIGLQDTTTALDFRVTVLEENEGSDGNSSVAELEVRVETLERTAAEHETRISAGEVDVDGRT